MVVLPDTQNYSDEYPEVFIDQTQWIANNVSNLNIKMVSHLGDIVDNGQDIRQWNNAVAAMGILDNINLPYGTCIGNHDILYPDYDAEAIFYRERFGPQKFAGKSWYGGV